MFDALQSQATTESEHSVVRPSFHFCSSTHKGVMCVVYDLSGPTSCAVSGDGTAHKNRARGGGAHTSIAKAPQVMEHTDTAVPGNSKIPRTTSNPAGFFY